MVKSYANPNAQYNPSGGGSDSDADRRKSARNAAPARPTRGSGGRGRRGKDSESEEESESEEFSDEEVVPAKKKKVVTANRSTPKRGAAQKGRKRKQDSESEDEVSEDESVEEEADSDDSAVSVYRQRDPEDNNNLLWLCRSKRKHRAKLLLLNRHLRKIPRVDRNVPLPLQRRSERMPQAKKKMTTERLKHQKTTNH